ncbi:MAG TPA: ATP-binding cassette domain-containing protein [Acidobacteriota bacterium]|nr:ATP-binding cassette domain-containing protein [Acidobacteriota bacterium]
MDTAIEIRNATKTFGHTTAVRDLNLVIPRGGLYGFIGPNGAGKTTTIRLIMSILFPDSGSVSVLGHASALEARSRIGYLPEERGVYRKMPVGAFLSYIARLKGLDERNLDKKVGASLERVGLGGMERKLCEEMSKGMLQKVQFLAAVIHRPDLLILDEPFSGLDPVSRRLLRDLVLEEHRRGATILFSTHVMPQAEEICRHVIMIHQGRKVLDDALQTIRSRYDPRTIEFDPLDAGADLSPVAELPGVRSVEKNGFGMKIFLADDADPAGAMRRIMEVAPPARLELSRPRLEDIFISLVSTETGSSEEQRKLRAALVDYENGEKAG